MKTQRVITGLVILLFAVLVVGCGQKTAPVTGESDPSDAGSDLPATSITPPTGWSVYRAADFSVWYPGDWNTGDDPVSDPAKPDLERVVFDDQPLQDRPGTDWMPDMMLESWSGTVEQVLAGYDAITRKTIKQIGDKQVTVFSYSSDFFADAQPNAYVFEHQGKVYRLQRFDGRDETINIMAESIIRSLEGK